MVTVRGRSDGKDGRIHTDSATKIITLLLYLNPGWERPDGRLRLLRGADDLDDYAPEVAPLAGTMVAFRRSDRSFHGHRPHVGERRMLQLNWVTEPAVVRRELSRHRWSARLKALNPFLLPLRRVPASRERWEAMMRSRSRRSCRADRRCAAPARRGADQIVDEFKFGVLAHDVGLFGKPCRRRRRHQFRDAVHPARFPRRSSARRARISAARSTPRARPIPAISA